MYLLSVLERVRRIDDDLIADIEASKNFKGSAKIAANRNRTQLHLAVFVDHGNLWSFGAKQHRIDGDRNALDRASGRKMHLTERTRQQLAVFVRHIHFRIKGARAGIDSISGTNDGSYKFLAGKFLQRNLSLHSNFHRRRIGLRNREKNAKRIDPR